MGFFKSKPVDRGVTLDESKLEDKLVTSVSSTRNRVLSTDRSVNNRVVLQTFIGDESLTSPEEIDLFLVNSVELSKRRESFIPWIPTKFEKDSFIDKAIQASISDEEFTDTIKASGIINVSSEPTTKTLEVF